MEKSKPLASAKHIAEAPTQLSDIALSRTALAHASACLDSTDSELEDLCLGPTRAIHLPKLNADRLKEFRRRFQDKTPRVKGLGTIEIVIIIAVLLALALLFREKITAFAQELMDKVFDSSILGDL